MAAVFQAAQSVGMLLQIIPVMTVGKMKQILNKVQTPVAEVVVLVKTVITATVYVSSIQILM